MSIPAFGYVNLRFHEFLKLENEIGNITRQEVVSMVGQFTHCLSCSYKMITICSRKLDGLVNVF